MIRYNVKPGALDVADDGEFISFVDHTRASAAMSADLFQARDALHKLEKQRAADIAILNERIDALEAQHHAAVVALGYADPDEFRT